VYKVYRDVRIFSGHVRKPDWQIENIQFGTPSSIDIRYMPGEMIWLNFDLVNYASQDLYIINAGIQPEWLVRERIWLSKPVKQLLKPGHRIPVQIPFNVPTDIELGEYELLFGIEGQYLPAQGYSNMSTPPMWTEPMVVGVKYPFMGETIFLSHSVKNMHLVRQLEKYLDNYGINVIIGEDYQQPSRNLNEKFMAMIDSSSIFLALLTDPAVRSEWVHKETVYALRTNKPHILLKEESVNLDWAYEYIPFSERSGPLAIFQTTMAAIQNMKNPQQIVSTKKLFDSPLIIIIGVAVLAFIAGWYLRK